MAVCRVQILWWSSGVRGFKGFNLVAVAAFSFFQGVQSVGSLLFRVERSECFFIRRGSLFLSSRSSTCGFMQLSIAPPEALLP